jgi:hypothetical protein
VSLEWYINLWVTIPCIHTPHLSSLLKCVPPFSFQKLNRLTCKFVFTVLSEKSLLFHMPYRIKCSMPSIIASLYCAKEFNLSCCWQFDACVSQWVKTV